MMNKKGKFDRLSPVHKKFYYWIEKKGLLRRFSANLDSRLQTWKLLDYLEDMSIQKREGVSKDHYLSNVVASAFIWETTIQGHSFWESIDTEWIEYYKTLKS